MDPQNVAAVAKHTEIAPTVSGNPIVLEALRATPGLRERLTRGMHVADVGCGEGVSTVTMALAFPHTRFLGIEADPACVERARQLAAGCGVRNVYWLAAAAHQLAPRPTHDLICAFSGMHDVSDPRGELRAIRAALAEDGVYLRSEAADDAGGVCALAAEAGFARVDPVRVDNAAYRVFALRR